MKLEPTANMIKDNELNIIKKLNCNVNYELVYPEYKCDSADIIDSVTESDIEAKDIAKDHMQVSIENNIDYEMINMQRAFNNVGMECSRARTRKLVHTDLCTTAVIVLYPPTCVSLRFIT